MAESILRTQVANLEIKQVLTLRDSLRDKARTEMMQTARGWGIWIETLELTEVAAAPALAAAPLRAAVLTRLRAVRGAAASAGEGVQPAPL